MNSVFNGGNLHCAILGYLSLRDIIGLGRVSRVWRRASRSDETLRYVLVRLIRPFPILVKHSPDQHLWTWFVQLMVDPVGVNGFVAQMVWWRTHRLICDDVAVTPVANTACFQLTSHSHPEFSYNLYVCSANVAILTEPWHTYIQDGYVMRVDYFDGERAFNILMISTLARIRKEAQEYRVGGKK